MGLALYGPDSPIHLTSTSLATVEDGIHIILLASGFGCLAAHNLAVSFAGSNEVILEHRQSMPLGDATSKLMTGQIVISVDQSARYDTPELR